MTGKRQLFFYKDYFRDFFSEQSINARNKILSTLKIIEEIDRIPEQYFKHLEGTNALNEIRVQNSNHIYRIFCFFDDKNLIVVGHGFLKKTQKTPLREIERAEKIKNEYYEEKHKIDKPR